MKRHRLALILTLCSAALFPLRTARLSPLPLTTEEKSVKEALRSLIRREDDAILREDTRRLQAVYAPRGSASALHHAAARRAFLHAWQQSRGVRIESVSVDLRTPSIKFSGKDRVRVAAVISEDFRYRHLLAGSVPDQFGLGTRRWYQLVRERSHWMIRSEEYTDPLDQDTRLPGEATPAAPRERPLGSSAGAPQMVTYSAMQAVHYGDAYCGAAPGCGNDRRYNAQYYDFNGEGGDCTNFVSQSLRAAGLRETAAWSWNFRRGEGTYAWSNAEGLVDFLAGSGRGTVFARGTYDTLTHPGADGSPAPVSRLSPGDIVGYWEKGRIVHLALVVGRDPQGYALVDTHTADRFHVPWDIGWDRSTRFLLVHVHYPTEQRAYVR